MWWGSGTMTRTGDGSVSSAVRTPAVQHLTRDRCRAAAAASARGHVPDSRGSAPDSSWPVPGRRGGSETAKLRYRLCVWDVHVILLGPLRPGGDVPGAGRFHFHRSLRGVSSFARDMNDAKCSCAAVY